LSSFFSKYVSGTEEIPWNDFFRSVGLYLVEAKNTVGDAGFAASRNFDGPMIVEAVTANSDAERTGLQTGDTILEINGRSVGQEASEEIAALASGDTVTLKVRSRRGGERELKWKVGARDEVTYELKDMDNISAEQRARRAAWLAGEAQPSRSTSVH
jgi:predicted metalloprotease with PDZ domain